MSFSFGRFRSASIILAITLAVSALTWVSSYSIIPSHDNAEAWLVEPSQLPKDVFDLPFFNRYRHPNGKLAVTQAQSALAFLSDTDLPTAQQLFDITAWKTFVALNWAAQPDGLPDSRKSFTDLGTPRVWEYWRQTNEVFRPHGEPPIPWEMWEMDDHTHNVDHFKAGWRQNTSVDQGREAFSGRLIDQNGRWLQYSAFINKPEFDYIIHNELYNLEGRCVHERSHH